MDFTDDTRHPVERLYLRTDRIKAMVSQGETSEQIVNGRNRGLVCLS